MNTKESAFALWMQTPVAGNVQDPARDWLTNQRDAFSAGWDAAVYVEARRTQAAKHLGGEDKSGLDFLGLASMIAIGAVCFVAGAMIF